MFTIKGVYISHNEGLPLFTKIKGIIYENVRGNTR
jgi:hypothetical protein